MTIELDGNRLQLNDKSLIIDNAEVTFTDETYKAREFDSTNGVWSSPEGGLITSIGTPLKIQNNGSVTLDGVRIGSNGDVAVWVGTSDSSGSLVINNADIVGREFAIGTLHGANVEINDGYFEAKDNAVIGGNGVSGRGDTNIVINNGSFVGGTITNGYIGCGIYHPQRGSLTINGGRFIIEGVAILMRGGQAEINGEVEITTTNANSGKVGDASTVVNSNCICVDTKSNYYDAANISVVVNDGLFNVIEPNIASIETIKSDSDTAVNRVSVVKGSFKPYIDEIYIANGSTQTIADNRGIINIG